MTTTTVDSVLRDALAIRTPEQVAADIIAKVMDARRKAEAAKAEAELARVKSAKPEPAKPETKSGPRLHYKFAFLRAAMAAGVDAVILVGPAGSGKTTAARMAAQELGRKFEATSFGPTTSKADLFGFIDAQGQYRDTGLVRAARDGGVFLGDEIDAGHAGVVVGLNMVTANPVFSTPQGMVEKHGNFVAVFGANTFGTGANRQYVGRNQLDAASLDRMVVIEWDLDPGLEAEMVGVKGVPSPRFDLAEGGTMSPSEWLKRVWSIRKAIEALGVRHVVSPRATQNGAKLFAKGVGRVHVENAVLWKGMDRDTRLKVEAKAME